MFRFTAKNMPLTYCVQYHLLKVRPCHSELLPRRSVVGEDPRRKPSYILNSPLIVGDIDAQFIIFICQIDVAAWYWQKRCLGLPPMIPIPAGSFPFCVGKKSLKPHICWVMYILIMCWLNLMFVLILGCCV